VVPYGPFLDTEYRRVKRRERRADIFVDVLVFVALFAVAVAAVCR
jgi:hypothetical protein